MAGGRLSQLDTTSPRLASTLALSWFRCRARPRLVMRRARDA